MSTIKIGLIGFGGINKAMANRCYENGWEVAFNTRSSGIYKGETSELLAPLSELKHYCQRSGLSAASLAISGNDDGKKEMEYIGYVLDAGIPIVLFGKGPRANYGAELKRLEDLMGSMIGQCATCGGGTMMMPYAKMRNIENVYSFDFSANGSCNSAWNDLSEGMPPEDVFLKAQKAHTLEPGSASFHEAIMAEACGDVPRKAVIFSKELGICKEEFRAKDIVCAPFHEDEFNQVVREASDWRLIVTLRRRGEVGCAGIAMTKVSFENWNLFFGWRNIKEEVQLQRLVGPGTSNTLVIEHYGALEPIILQGPGAGTLQTSLAGEAELRGLLARFYPPEMLMRKKRS